MYKYLQLKIGDLLINNENPRYESVEQQREAIEVMIREQNDKLVELGKHIVGHGLSPIDVVLVKPIGKLWLVQEGNRRITALKLLANPSLIPDDLKNIKRQFIGLATDIDSDLLEKIPCVHCDNEEEANEWIRLKHTGENAGAGTVKWDAQQAGRFSLRTSDRPDPKMIFLEDLKSNTDLPKDIRGQTPKILKTNFERLISDPAIRDFVGITYKNQEFKVQKPVSDRFLLMLKDLIGDELIVTKIYHKKDRAGYIDSLSERLTNKSASEGFQASQEVAKDNSNRKKDGVNDENNEKDLESDSYNKGKKKKSYPIDRNTIIPSVCTMPIDKGRISLIFRELKKLPIDEYPNASAVLFRVFVELSIDSFISRKHLTGVSINKELNTKITAVADFLEINHIMTSKELFTARKMISGQFQTQSVQTFHNYVHNANISPVPRDLCSAWHDISQFIEKIWEEA